MFAKKYSVLRNGQECRHPFDFSGFCTCSEIPCSQSSTPSKEGCSSFGRSTSFERALGNSSIYAHQVVHYGCDLQPRDLLLSMCLPCGQAAETKLIGRQCLVGRRHNDERHLPYPPSLCTTRPSLNPENKARGLARQSRWCFTGAISSSWGRSFCWPRRRPTVRSRRRFSEDETQMTRSSKPLGKWGSASMAPWCTVRARSTSGRA